MRPLPFCVIPSEAEGPRIFLGANESNNDRELPLSARASQRLQKRLCCEKRNSKAGSGHGQLAGGEILMDAFLMLLRWLHFLFGITWIGLLYYFNLVQTPFFGETDPAVRSGAIQKLVPRALWWFRWGAMGTVIFGLLYLLSCWGILLNYPLTPPTSPLFT